MSKTVPFVVVFLLLSAPLALAQQQDPAKPETPYQQSLTEAQKKLEAAQKKLDEATKDAGDQNAGPADDLLKDMFGTAELNKKIEAMKAASRNIVVTDDDRQAFEAYLASDFPFATKYFSDSLYFKPNRELPQYFLGCISFQNADYAAAADSFAKVIAINKDVNSAHLLLSLSKLCQANPPTNDRDLITLFYQACYQTAKDLNLQPPKPSLTANALPDLTSDPVLFKSQELLFEIAPVRLQALAQSPAWTQTPAQKLMVALTNTPHAQAPKAAQDFAHKFPNNRDLQLFSFLLTYFNARSDAPLPATFANDLAAARKLDPTNGVLDLLAIFANAPKPAPGRVEDVPLTKDELVLLHRAATAERFDTYSAFMADPDFAFRFKLFGGFSSQTSPFPHPNVFPALLQVARRAQTTFKQMLADNKVNDALSLYRDIHLVAAKIAALHPHLWYSVLSETWVMSPDALALKNAAVNPALLQAISLDGMESRLRTNLEFSTALEHLAGLRQVPISRMANLARSYETSAELRHSLYVWLIQNGHSDSATCSTLKDIQRDLEMKILRPRDDVLKGVILLGDTKSKEAVPVLEKLFYNSDPLLARLAAKALNQIASKPQ